MKYFAIIFTVCIASSFAVSLNAKQKSMLLEFKTTCIAETQVNPDAVENAKKGIVDEGDAKLACFAACFLKKAGFMNAEGAFDEEGFRSKLPADIPKEKVDAIVDKCKSQTGANACETGAKLLKCYLKNKTISLFEPAQPTPTS